MALSQFWLFVVSAGCLALAVFVHRAGKGSEIHRWFALYIACAAAWAFGIAGRQWGTHLEAWNDVVFASASLLPSTFLGFTCAFPRRASWVPRWAVTATVVVGATFAVMAAATPLVYFDPVVTPEGFARKSGALYSAFATYLLLVWTLALVTLFGKWRASRGTERVQLRYLAWAFLLSGLGAMTTNLILPWITGRSTYTWFGPYFGVFLIGLIAHTIIRHRLMNLRLVVHQGLTMAIATFLTLAPVGIVVLLVWPRLAARLAVDELLVLIGALFAVGLLSPFARDGATTVLDRYVYRTHASYQRTVREASGGLARVLNRAELLEALRTTLRDAVRPDGIAIYAADTSKLCRVDPPSFEELPASVAERLARTKDAVAVDHLGPQSDSAESRQLLAEMHRRNWAVVLPLLAEDALIGAIALGPKLSGDAFYREDLGLLMTLANQAGVALKNAQRYAEVVVAHEYIARIVASISSGVVAVNTDGQIIVFNDAAAKLTGLAASEVRQRFAAALPQPISEALTTALRRGEAVSVPEVSLMDGTISRPVLVTASPVLDASGAIVGAVSAFSDLTPLKELEMERRKAEKLAYFEMLASGVAHEIKNPLVGIKAFAQLLPRRPGDEQFIEEFGRISTREIARIERLLERLRALGQPSERPHVRIDLRRAIGEAIEFMQPMFVEKGINVVETLADAPVGIVGNYDGMKQLAINLLMNAYEATPPAGRVTVELACEANAALLTVADTGTGIAPELLDRIFDPFMTTKRRGSGLGLAISAGMAAMHGGTLRAANAPSGGARFTLSLPLAATGVTVAA
jgi:PAS domain S-box-containing protein